MAGGLSNCEGTIENCIVWGNSAPRSPQLDLCSEPGDCRIQDRTGGGWGIIVDDPRFLDPDGPDDVLSTYGDNDHRLRADSPCIDRGYNAAIAMTDTDTRAMHRIMFGGQSLTVDMGAYRYYRNEIEYDDGKIILTRSSLWDRTYIVYFSTDMVTWEGAVSALPSAGDTTSSWTDDGALATVPLFLVPRRSYRVLENP